VRENAGGQYLHLLKDADPIRGRAYRFDFVPPAPPVARAANDWTSALNFYARDAATAIGDLAQRLGVSAVSLAALEVGWHPSLRFWTFPERDADGRVIGVLTRHESGNKKRLKGSKAGLTFAPGWDAGAGPILLVEGPSDVAALMTIGLNATGRPSNFGGVEYLIELLFDVPDQRQIVVIGENDKKSDGKWPGRDGAISTATRLAEGLERPVAWAFPPDDAKDSRAWLKSMPELPAVRLADLFITGLDTKTINPPVTIRIEPEPHVSLPLAKWRDNMLQARLASLGKPGIYLDRSPTGSGKSHVDFVAIEALLQREDAA
jgi:hypothetical protein